MIYGTYAQGRPRYSAQGGIGARLCIRDTQQDWRESCLCTHQRQADVGMHNASVVATAWRLEHGGCCTTHRVVGACHDLPRQAIPAQLLCQHPASKPSYASSAAAGLGATRSFAPADGGTITLHKRNCPNAIRLAAQYGDSIITNFEENEAFLYPRRIRIKGI